MHPLIAQHRSGIFAICLLERPVHASFADDAP